MIKLKDYIADVPNFPKEGILFRDITPLLQNGLAFQKSIDELQKFAKDLKPDLIVGPESRGFIFGCPLADRMGIGFVPVRKPGKLPRKVKSIKYDLEYGTNTFSIHADAIKLGQKVLVIDDLLATGGTIKAAIELIENMGGVVVGCGFLIKLTDLEGDKKLSGYKLKYLLEY